MYPSVLLNLQVVVHGMVQMVCSGTYKWYYVTVQMVYYGMVQIVGHVCIGTNGCYGMVHNENI